jgi:homoserine kinase type II
MAILTSLGTDDVATICAAFGVTPASSEGVLAGSVNTNYRIEATSGATWFLRVYEEQGLEGATRDTRLALRLSHEGVPTPAPAERLDGGGAIVVHRGKPCALMPFVRGVHRCQRSVTATDAAAVGAALARVHRVGLGFRPDEALTVATRFDGAALRARLAVTPLDSDELRGARLRIEAALDEVGARPPSAAAVPLVHGDLFRDNVLFSDQGPVLLDFESASVGAVAFDLAVTILAWCFGDQLDLELGRAMGEGYRAVRSPTAGEQADLFDAARLACARFATTRITDYELRPRGVGVYKDFRRWLARLDAVERLGRPGFAGRFGLA